jgi:small subunit ribosomal protein S1
MEKGIPEKEQAPVKQNQAEEQPGWFQDFVDHYEVDSPQQGEILEGAILDISENSILLDVGLKRDAIITSQDLDKVDDEIVEDLEVGGKVYVSVIRTPIGDDDLLVSLSRGLAYKDWQKAEEYLENEEMLELEIIDKNRGGVLVGFESLQGFVPNSHIPSLRRGTPNQKASEIKEEMIGDTLPVKVIEVDRKQRRLVFSARIAQKKQREKRLRELEEGDVIKSRVVNVVDFGVFVDLDGVDGLVHKSEIAWDRVYDPSKYFQVGDEIEVKVVDVDVERERVSLSRKALLPNPWDKLDEKYDEGDLVEGKVVSVLDFGAFVELPEGLQGLVHVSEIGYANMGDPRSVVQEGDKVLVRVLNVEPDRERVSLSMRRVPVEKQMEWMMTEEESAAEAEEEEAAQDAVPAGEETEEAEQGEAAQAAASTEEESQDAEETGAAAEGETAAAQAEEEPAEEKPADTEEAAEDAPEARQDAEDSEEAEEGDPEEELDEEASAEEPEEEADRQAEEAADEEGSDTEESAEEEPEDEQDS